MAAGGPLPHRGAFHSCQMTVRHHKSYELAMRDFMGIKKKASIFREEHFFRSGTDGGRLHTLLTKNSSPPEHKLTCYTSYCMKKNIP